MRYASPLLALMIGAAVVPPATAQTDKRYEEQIRRLRQQVQQSQQATQAAEAKLTQQKADLDADRAQAEGAQKQQLRRAEGRLAELQQQVDALQRDRDSLSTRAGDAERQLADSRQQLKMTNDRLAAAGASETQLRMRGDALSADIQRCEANNVALYGYSRELMTLYQNKGLWAALGQGEPITALSRVKVENVLEEYRDKLDAQRYQGGSGKP